MAARKKTDLTYAEATEELEGILDGIESGEADVDVLSDQVERAATLIKFCREKLAGTELRVNKVVEELASDRASDDDED